MSLRLIVCAVWMLALSCTSLSAQEAGLADVVISIDPDTTKQTFDGMGCGSIFYSGHLNSLGKRDKHDLQSQLYDDLFTKIPTQFLHVMIRPSFEPVNDNDDPYTLDFPPDAFKKNADVLDVYREARKRRPDMEVYATLYTPPAWMKTNGQESGGGKRKGNAQAGAGSRTG